jgi:autotransporter passenger strand-loop-strand repeat protein
LREAAITAEQPRLVKGRGPGEERIMTTVTVTSGQTYPVSSGETDIGDTVLFGGTLEVLSGGTTSNTVISGGSEQVLSGDR